MLTEVENLAFHYGGADGFSLNIAHFGLEEGQHTALIGPSGCGKTTLLHLLGGILVPTAGSITHQGTELSALSDAARRAFRIQHIGLVFQAFELLDYLNIIDNVLVPYRINKALTLDEAVAPRTGIGRGVAGGQIAATGRTAGPAGGQVAAAGAAGPTSSATALAGPQRTEIATPGAASAALGPVQRGQAIGRLVRTDVDDHAGIRAVVAVVVDAEHAAGQAAVRRRRDRSGGAVVDPPRLRSRRCGSC